MSMDDVLHGLQIFTDDMEEFTATMASAAGDLEQEHSSLIAIWNDTFSQDYRTQWRSFEGNLARYLQTDAHRYRDFLDDRTGLLRRYLNG